MEKAIINMLLQISPALLFFGVALAASYAIPYLLHRKRRHRRNPLTVQLLRGPGESLRSRTEDLKSELITFLFMIIVMPIILYASYLSQLHFSNSGKGVLIAIYLVSGMVFLGYIVRKLTSTSKELSENKLGLDCEVAVGQELNQLMLNGYKVYHDFPAEKFNIDHIVIGRSGVFAVETKGRAKPIRNLGKEDAKVIFDGQTLKFPTWTEKKPIEQARGQAEWLSRWLKASLKEDIPVRAVLALPGWFIERKDSSLLIYNGKHPQFLTTIRTEKELSETLLNAIDSLVEARCRDIEPSALRNGN